MFVFVCNVLLIHLQVSHHKNNLSIKSMKIITQHVELIMTLKILKRLKIKGRFKILEWVDGTHIVIVINN